MHWMDLLKFEPLVDRLAEIDRELAALGELSEGVDADAFGIFDDLEELIGEGFLRCQHYMIERKGEHRSENPFTCGPRHNSYFIAQIINTAGNYRKHRAEWPSDEASWEHQQHKTVAVLRDAGVTGTSYCLSTLLYCVTQPNPALFGSLVPRIVEWREALDDERRARSSMHAE